MGKKGDETMSKGPKSLKRGEKMLAGGGMTESFEKSEKKVEEMNIASGP